MQLIFWRHADAEDTTPDLERELSTRGREQAHVSAKWLKSRLPQKPRILVSPATRTRQTAAALGMAGLIVEPRLAPGASVSSVLEALKIGANGMPVPGRHGELQDTLVVVGHQPWIGQVIAQLMCGEPEYWKIRKAALWWLVQRGAEPWSLLSVTDADLI